MLLNGALSCLGFCMLVSDEHGVVAAGLAHDALSTENAVAILHTMRPPLILDPSGQASHWLQARLKAQGTSYEVVPMHSDRSAANDCLTDTQHFSLICSSQL